MWIPGRRCGFGGGGERAWTLTERRSEYKLGGTKLRTRTLEQVESPGRPGCFVQVPGDILSGRVPVVSRPRVGDTGYREVVSLGAVTVSPTCNVPMSLGRARCSLQLPLSCASCPPGMFFRFPACSQSSSDFRSPASPAHFPTLS